MHQQNLMISFLQVFGILLVVIGHSFYGCQNDIFIYTWIYSFHMPLFMFISGYLLEYTMKMKRLSLGAMSLHENKSFVVKKMKRLLIPYVVISSLAFFPKALMNKFAVCPIEISWTGFIDMLIYPCKNVIVFYWFLPTLFFIFCIVIYSAYILKRLNLKVPCLFVLLLLLVLHLFNPLKEISLLNIGGVVNYIIYFVSGYYFCKRDIEYKLLINPIITLLITLSLSILFIFFPAFEGKGLLTAFNGILMSISIGQLYVKYNWRFFYPLFGASFAIYLFSWFPQALAQQIFLSVTHAPWQLATCLAIVLGVCIPLWIYKWIVRNKQRKYGKLISILTGL